ncbi:RHS repeat domain-containing protein [Segatella baroniae]|uniref:RHS repeat domain-containing protein n=1 Tax=Segatella baroniae TaxID=305719 RepID=UPI0008B24469|nr:RHS repeat-associated core domain-containing protein [Segatella baroniae]SEQ96806.1 RHS repeat-associated core domain-containing protein [Segatella baroniae B14]
MVKTYLAFTDNLGSILSVMDENGTQVFDASYDVWGRQTVTLNTIGLHRGYTGHEMLMEFDIINMNGRLYDPVLGRFFSPDNYVQMPDNSQNFNRYSYCLNNPLKYTDPSGDFWNLIIGAAIGGVFNWASHGFQLNAKGLGYFATGAVAGAVGAGLASGVNVAMAGGNFWTGAAGLAKGIASTGFLAGAASGASAGFAGGFIYGAGNSWVDGHSFGKGLLAGLESGGIGALESGLTGGIFGGIDAMDNHANFWTGRGYFDTTGAMAYQGCKPKEFKIGDKIKAKYVGRFEGQRVFESKYLGSLSSGEYAAFTLPDIGIFAGEGVFSSSQINGLVMMQHEFGHVLQYRKVGIDFYYEVIAKESAMNCNNFFNILHMKKISIVVKIVLMLLILDIFSSCIMDRKTTLYIKNCTKDTLLIELSEADTLVNWQFWGKQAADVVSPNDTDEVDIAFNKAIIGSFALPDSTIYIDPYIYSHYDTCYLYTIKWNIAKKYSMDEIRAKKLYDRRTVTKKNFHNRLFEYKK